VSIMDLRERLLVRVLLLGDGSHQGELAALLDSDPDDAEFRQRVSRRSTERPSSSA